MSSAFKGEYFVASGEQKFRMTEAKTIEYLSSSNAQLYSFDGETILGNPTNSLIKRIEEQPSFLKIANGEKKPYYYRPLEEEFKVKK